MENFATMIFFPVVSLSNMNSHKLSLKPLHGLENGKFLSVLATGEKKIWECTISMGYRFDISKLMWWNGKIKKSFICPENSLRRKYSPQQQKKIKSILCSLFSKKKSLENSSQFGENLLKKGHWITLSDKGQPYNEL